MSLESVSSAVRAVSRLLCDTTLPLPKYPEQSSVTQLRSPDLQLSPVEFGIDPICMAQPPSVGPVMMPYIGDRIVAVAESEGGANSRVNNMTMASAKLASFVTEVTVNNVQHPLVLSK